jgi:hypothetical protein
VFLILTIVAKLLKAVADVLATEERLFAALATELFADLDEYGPPTA